LVGKPPFNGRDAAELKEKVNEEEYDMKDCFLLLSYL